MDTGGLTPRSLRIGLTGGIGSGKTTVGKLFAKAGAVLIDTDLIARQLTLPGGAAIPDITRAFGPEVIDAAGALDRVRVRELVFSDAAAKRRLEAILHPLIGIETERQARASSAPVLVFDVPLLVESARWRARVDKVLTVDCRETTQIERVIARSGWTGEAVRAVIESQASRRERRACSDAVLYNDNIAFEQLADDVVSLWQQWSGATAH